MSEPVSSSRRGRFSRVLLFIFAGILLLVAGLYLLVTSSSFLRSVALPRVGAAMNAQVTAQEISLRPFSRVALRNLNVQTTGSEPLVKAESAEVNYDLMSILRGTIDVSGITLNSAAVTIVQEPDGKSNLDPLLKKDSPETPKSEAPPQLAIRNVTLKNATVRLIEKQKDGSSQTTELKNLDVTLDRLANGQPGKLAISSDVELAHRFPSPVATNDLLSAKVAGNFNFSLDRELLPETAQGDLKLEVLRGEGTYSDLVGLTGNLAANVTPSEIRELTLQFERGRQRLGQIAVSGPLDLNKSEARLAVSVQSIDRQVLNLVGAAQGFDFGETTISATNLIEITRQGSNIGATGRLAGSKVALVRGGQSTPPLDLAVDYETTLNLSDKTAVVQKLDVVGRQNQADLLRASLDRPMSLSWGAATNGLPDSTFQLAVNQLDLHSWRAVVGTNLPSGKVDVQLNVRSERSGTLLTTKLAAGIRDLALQVGTNAISQAQARFETSAQIEEMKRVNVGQYQFEVRQRDQSLAKGSGSGRYDLSNQAADVQVLAEASLPALLSQFSVPETRASSGVLKINTRLVQQSGNQGATGTLELNDFTGQSGAYALQSFHTGLDYDVELAGGWLQIKRGVATLRQGNTSAGAAELTGRYHLTNAIAELNFKLTDLNQNALRPLLAPSLGEMKLVSASLSGSGSAKHDPKAESSVQAELNLVNWVAEDPKLELPKTPLGADVQVDGVLRQQNVDLKKFTVALRQGNAPAGNIDLNGKYHLTNQAAQVTFKVAGLDQTALRPALASALGENKLISIAVNASGSAGYDPVGDSPIKADLSVTNLVVQDPKQTLTRTPLSAQVQVDGSIRKQILDLRQFLIALAPTARAKNQLQAQGRIDLNATNATPSQLNVRAESLDLTPYYDLFAGKAAAATNSAIANTPSAPTPTPRPGAPAPAVAAKEPDPIALPFQQFTGDVKIDRFYLRDLAITNLQTVAKMDRGVVTLKPVQLALNGAPVNASVTANVGVPGYQYDIALDADRIPVEPLVNTFSPESAGRYRGDVIARAQIKGAGTTGASLQKSLTGQTSLSLTNMNLEIVGPKIRRLLEPIALALRVPELTQTPLNWVAANATLGQGRIDVTQFSVLSQAFYAEGQGALRIAEVLTNSPVNIPVNLALRRSLAEKARLIPPDAPTNTAYVALPTFVTLAGTLGDPQADINKLAVAGLLAQTAARLPKVSGEAGAILEGIGGILSGQRPSLVNTNLPRQTNAVPATNKPPALNPLDLLRILPQKKQ